MKKEKLPLISIVMPVYNAGLFLTESLESILAQSYENWELICVDDASIDNSYDILQIFALKDKRIHIFRLKKNLGVSSTANFAISKIKGKFLARMDADDIMLSDRLDKQLKFLLVNKKTIIVGGQCYLINEDGQLTGQKLFPKDHQKLYKMLYRAMPLQQPSVMINTNLLPKNFNWYEKKHKTGEEVSLLFRLLNYGQFANLEDFILKYRIHGKNLSLVNPKKTFLVTFQTRLKAEKLYGYKPDFSSRIINLLQYIIIGFLPEKLIYPLFSIWRGLRPIEKINIVIAFPVRVKASFQKIMTLLF